MGKRKLKRDRMFDNVIGNEKIKEVLSKSLENNKILHSYLFIGIEGIGKKNDCKTICKENFMLRQQGMLQ